MGFLEDYELESLRHHLKVGRNGWPRSFKFDAAKEEKLVRLVLDYLKYVQAERKLEKRLLNAENSSLREPWKASVTGTRSSTAQRSPHPNRSTSGASAAPQPSVFEEGELFGLLRYRQRPDLQFK